MFLFAAPQSERPLAWTANAMLLNVTAPGLRQQQESLADALQTVRGQFDPRETTILTVTGQDPYRFMMYYLPEYVVLRLDPANQSVLTASGQHQGTWQQPSGCLLEGDRVRHAVWVLGAGRSQELCPTAATRVSSADTACRSRVGDATWPPNARVSRVHHRGDVCSSNEPASTLG